MPTSFSSLFPFTLPYCDWCFVLLLHFHCSMVPRLQTNIAMTPFIRAYLSSIAFAIWSSLNVFWHQWWYCLGHDIMLVLFSGDAMPPPHCPPFQKKMRLISNWCLHCNLWKIIMRAEKSFYWSLSIDVPCTHRAAGPEEIPRETGCCSNPPPPVILWHNVMWYSPGVIYYVARALWKSHDATGAAASHKT